LRHDDRGPLIAEMDPVTAPRVTEGIPTSRLRTPDLCIRTAEQDSWIQRHVIDLRLGRELETLAFIERGLRAGLIDFLRRRRTTGAVKQGCCQYNTKQVFLSSHRRDRLQRMFQLGSIYRSRE